MCQSCAVGLCNTRWYAQKKLAVEIETGLMARARYLRRPITAEKQSLYSEYPGLDQRGEPTNHYRTGKLATEPIRGKRASHQMLYEKLKAKKSRTVSFAVLGPAADEVVSIKTKSDSYTLSHTQQSGNKTLSTNIGSVEETVAIPENQIRFTPLPKPYSMVVQYYKDWHDLASFA